MLCYIKQNQCISQELDLGRYYENKIKGKEKELVLENFEFSCAKLGYLGELEILRVLILNAELEMFDFITKKIEEYQKKLKEYKNHLENASEFILVSINENYYENFFVLECKN